MFSESDCRSQALKLAGGGGGVARASSACVPEGCPSGHTLTRLLLYGSLQKRFLIQFLKN